MVLLAAAAAAQTGVEFKPQVDTYYGLTPNIDVYLLAEGTTGADGANPEVVIGPNIDIAVLRFVDPHLLVLNPARSKYLTFTAGYRYVQEIGGQSAVQNNGVLELTPRFPLPLRLEIADRNRIDLRGLPNRFNWRYRNRLTLSRSFKIRSLAVTPYGEGEIFYDCSSGVWTKYSYQTGAIFRLTDHVELEPYYKRLNTIQTSAERLNQIGLRLSLFFHMPAPEQ